MSAQQPDLGDLFAQRRSAAAKQKQQQQQQQQQQRPQQSPSSEQLAEGSNHNTTPKKKSSFLEIQAEQESERLPSRHQSYPPSSSVQRQGGGGSGGGDDFTRRNQSSRSPIRRTFESNSNFNNNNNILSNSGHRRSSSNNNTGRGGRSALNRPAYDQLPLEQGVICSLKESFGFVHCADRPEQMFFHYSELIGCRSDELHIDDEVEFRVHVQQARNDNSNYNSTSDKKNSALQVRVLEKGTIVWETEDEPGVRRRGTIERPARLDSKGNCSSNVDGTIRLMDDQPKDEETTKIDATTTESTASPAVDANGIIIRYRYNDYQPSDGSTNEQQQSSKSQDIRVAGPISSPSTGSVPRLSKGDVIEFSIVTDRRTKLKYARSITLLQSERERLRLVREEELLANATVEQGVVTSLKSDYGFLRSNRRKEAVYFHYSNVLMPNESEEDFILKEGQDVNFLVVVEESGDGDDGKQQQQQRRRVSAREVELLPSGSVVFSNTLALAVTGVVTRCPQPVDLGHSDDVAGTIQLSEPLHDKDDQGQDVVVTQVLISSKDSPGGDFSYRSGAAVGLWIREGDTLLFDVTKDIVDGTYRASPTKYTQPLAALEETENETDSTKNAAEEEAQQPSLTPAVRLVSLSFVSRAEGVIHAIKENYGFIHYAERIVDVHFRLFEVLPDELQVDLRRNMLGCSQKLRLEVGTEVQFDLSLHGKVSHPATRGGGRNSFHNNNINNNNSKLQERENLKAQRLLLVPPGTVVQEKVLAAAVKGVVAKEDQKQPHAGSIDLEQEVQLMTMEERFPLVAKMIQTFLANNSQPSLVYPDLLSLKESDVITEMAMTIGKGLLECIFIPFAADLSHPGRLCIRKTTLSEETTAVSEEEEKPMSVDDEHTSPSNDSPVSNSGRAKTTPNKKKGRNRSQPVKTLRYDRHCFTEEFRDAMPPCEGDIIVCDVVQSRKTGQVSLANVAIVERKSGTVELSSEFQKRSGLGIVKEIAQSRQYGFISVHDENSTKAELLFFHMSDTKHASEGDKKQITLRKGDEVKFDFGKEKNGKKIAKHVEWVPKGTVPVRTEKNACRGYILMVPSHTKITNTPLRHSGSNSSAPGGSRWDNVKDEPSKATTAPSTADLGSILLLDDPGNLFGRSVAPDTKKEDEGGSEEQQPPGEVAAEAANATHTVEKTTKQDTISGVGSRIHYSLSAVTGHGQGSEGSAPPRRGDLVSFMKGKNGIRDVRVLTCAAAKLVKGQLVEIVQPQPNSDQRGTAKFIIVDGDNKDESYDVDLYEVISCNCSLLKEKEPVEGILYDGKIFGICRISDVHLESKLGSSHKERPKLNLTVRRDRGGTIMAQSMMARGPDGTDGFVQGWTQRTSSSLLCEEFAELLGQGQTLEHS